LGSIQLLIDKAEGIHRPTSSSNEVKSDESVAPQENGSRGLRKRSFINAKSPLEIIPFRVSRAYLDPSMENDLKANSLFAELQYHSPEVTLSRPRLRRHLPDMRHGFPLYIQGSYATDPQAIIWEFKDFKRLFYLLEPITVRTRWSGSSL
jgi:hypothetical protein